MSKIALMMLAGATVSTVALADESAMTRDEVRSMVAEMLSDAETRSSLLQGGGLAGYDKGFVIGSADGNWKLKFNGLVQFRYVMDFRNSTALAPAGVAGSIGDELSNGFQMRKTRVVLSGNAVNPNLTYKIAFENGVNNVGVGADPSYTGWNANDIYFGYKLDGGWAVRGGQYKVGFLKEELMSETVTLPVERGIMNMVFNQGRSQGVGLTFEDEKTRCSFDYSDGFNTAGTDFPSATQFAPTPAGQANNAESEFAADARGEYKWAGSWDALADFTSKPGDAQAGAVGGAAYWQHGTEPNASQSTNVWGATLDVQWEGNGWSAYAAGVYQNQRQGSTAGVGNAIAQNWGLCAQLGYRWNETSEVFVRGDAVFLDKDDLGYAAYELANPGTDNDCYFITFGYNHYFAGNNAKLSFDFIWALSGTDGLGASSSLTNAGRIGFQGSGPAQQAMLGQRDSGEFAIRAQFQLAF